jgi:hypothetical protein
MRKSYLFLLILLVSFLFYNGCKDSGNDPLPGDDSRLVTTTISGTVLDEFDTPLAGVEVKTADQTVMTNSLGGFSFSNVQVPVNRFVVNATKSGYFRGSLADVPKANGTSNIKIYLVSAGVTETISASSGGIVQIASGTGVEIISNSVVNKDGSAYNGNVNVSVAYLDPTSENFANVIPGGDLQAVRTDNSPATLYSYGIIKVEMKNDAGSTLQIKNGNTSTITVEIPGSMVSSAPQTIPLWHYDDATGLWKEEGTATKQGDKYVGTVGHFSDWNCDVPQGTATVKGMVVDCKNQPVPGVSVQIGQASAITGYDGKFERRVPAGVPFSVQVLPSKNFGLASTAVSVPPLAEGAIHEVGNLAIDCPVYVKGIIKCGTDIKYGQVVMSWDGGYNAQYTDSEGKFNLAADINKSAQISIYTLDGKYKVLNVTTPSVRGNVLELGIIEVCDQVQAGINKFTINGNGYNNKTFQFSATGSVYGFYDPEDSVTLVFMVETFQTDSVYFFMIFKGDKTGLASESGLYLSINGNAYLGSNDIENGSAVINVTRYDGIGGLKEGNFSGELVNLLDGQVSIVLSNGQFSAIRMVPGSSLQKSLLNKLPPELRKKYHL